MVFVVLSKFVVGAANFDSLRGRLEAAGWALTEPDYGGHDRRFEAAAPAGAGEGALGRAIAECGLAAEVTYFRK
jgi:hypothetical protein